MHFMGPPSSQSWRYLMLGVPHWVHHHLSQHLRYFYDILVSVLLPQEWGDVLGTQSCSGPSARQFPPSLQWLFTLFPCALMPSWLGAFSNETNGSWKYTINKRGNLWEVLLTPKEHVLLRDWKLLLLLLLLFCEILMPKLERTLINIKFCTMPKKCELMA